MGLVLCRAGPEILGAIDGLRRISIIWGFEFFFTSLGASIYKLFRKFWGLEGNFLSGLAQDRPWFFVSCLILCFVDILMLKFVLLPESLGGDDMQLLCGLMDRSC